jgi:PAS domain S-box-containing protein
VTSWTGNPTVAEEFRALTGSAGRAPDLSLGDTGLHRFTAEQLRESEDRFRYLVDGVRDYALFMLDTQGHVLSWNTGAQRLKGYTAEEIIGQHFSIFYPSEVAEADHPNHELRMAVAQGRYAEENWRVRKDGSRFMARVVITAIRDDAGALKGFAKLTQDVTEEKRVLWLLREQAQILDLANDTIFVRDSQDRIVYWNRGAERVYGWTKDEAMGQVTHLLLQTQFPKPLEDILADLQRQGHWEGELRHRDRSGAELILASRWTLFREGDQSDRIIEMNHDITELKELERTLQLKNQELQDAVRAKDTFLANMSHELRTPLNAIIGFSELLADGRVGPVTSEQKDCLTDVLNSSRHLLQLINDLLDLTKIGAGKMELRVSAFSPTEVLDGVCQLMRPLMQEKGIRLLKQTATAPREVVLDEQRFMQILFNLLSNAVKFTHAKGEVGVSLEATGAAEFVLNVRDTGIGIAAEDLGRLFRDFGQLDSGTSRRYQGTGLGLALTRRLVELQQGRIDVQSTVGKGSTFTVKLPVALPGEST